MTRRIVDDHRAAGGLGLFSIIALESFSTRHILQTALIIINTSRRKSLAKIEGRDERAGSYHSIAINLWQTCYFEVTYSVEDGQSGKSFVSCAVTGRHKDGCWASKEPLLGIEPKNRLEQNTTKPTCKPHYLLE
jgi:hypothetical protein